MAATTPWQSHVYLSVSFLPDSTATPTTMKLSITTVKWGNEKLIFVVNCKSQKGRGLFIAHCTFTQHYVHYTIKLQFATKPCLKHWFFLKWSVFVDTPLKLTLDRASDRLQKKKEPISWEVCGNFWGEFCWKTIGKNGQFRGNFLCIFCW